jgi:hypothetical protein
MDGSKALELTTKDEFINGKTKLFIKDEAKHENEKGYRFLWGTLSEKKANEDDVTWIVFGIRWGKTLMNLCQSAEMSGHAVLDATMMFLPGSGEKTTDVWSDDNDLDEFGAFFIDLAGTDGFSEKALREDVWDTYIIRMPEVAEQVLGITGQFKHDSSYLVSRMVEKPEKKD